MSTSLRNFESFLQVKHDVTSFDRTIWQHVDWEKLLYFHITFSYIGLLEAEDSIELLDDLLRSKLEAEPRELENRDAV